LGQGTASWEWEGSGRRGEGEKERRREEMRDARCERETRENGTGE
jgi:hypothetical protein